MRILEVKLTEISIDSKDSRPARVSIWFVSLLVFVSMIVSTLLCARDLLNLQPGVSIDFKLYGSSKPQGIAFHPIRKTFFVTTRTPGVLLEFDWAGNLLEEYSVAHLTDVPEGVSYDWMSGNLLLVKGNSEIFYFDPLDPLAKSGLLTTISESIDAEGIAVHPLTGEFYVADDEGGRIVRTTRQGVVLSSINLGALGYTDPQGVSFYGTYLLVVDDVDSTSSLLLLSIDGEVLQQVDTKTLMGIEDPDGIAALGQRQLCIAGDLDFRVVCLANRVSTVAIPRSLSLPRSFVGLSIVNNSSRSNLVNIFGYDSEGRQTFFNQMPAIPPGGQRDVLVEELLEATRFSALTSSESLRVGDTTSLILHGQDGSIQGFFMSGDFNRERLDGIGLALEESEEFFFPFISPGLLTQAKLFLANTTLLESSAILSLYDSSGELVAEQDLVINALGSIQGDIDEFFSDANDRGGYIRVHADPPLIGFETAIDGDAYAMIQGQRTSDSRISFSPHVFTTGNGATTEIRIINTSKAENSHYTLSLFSEEGELISEAEIELRPGELFLGDLESLFGSLQPLSRRGVFQGYLGMEVVGVSIGPFEGPAQFVASLTYNGTGGMAKTVLPLESRAFTDHLFSWVADNPEVNIRQGLAILNPRLAPAVLNLTVLNRDGAVQFERVLEILPKQKIVGLLDEAQFFGENFDQVGGSLIVSGTGVTMVTSVFVGSRYLSYIESQAPLE